MFFLNVTRRLLHAALVTFFLLWVSNVAIFAHSSDFVFARWSQDQVDGSVELSLSIQISDNPNIENREQAVEALTSLIQVRSGIEGEFVPIANVAKASFEDDISFPQDSPVPIGGAGLEELESGVVEEENETNHEVLTLKWKWKPSPDEKQVSFFLPDDCQQNVVFWWAGAPASGLPPGKEVPWQIMLGGDESFPLVLKTVGNEVKASPGVKTIKWKMFLAMGLVVALAIIYLIAGRGKAETLTRTRQ